MVTTAGSVERAEVPGPREPDEILDFASADGTELYGEYFSAASPRGLALVLHGYAEHCGRYREVAHVLTDSGLSAMAFDMRGHGRSEGQRGHVQRFTDYLEDIEAALAELEARGGDRPVALVAHSNGALAALRLLADPFRCPNRVRAAILSSPFLGLRMKVSPLKSALGRIAGLVAPRLSMPNGIAIDDLTHDAGKLAERRLDTLCHDVASARWFTEATATQKWVQEFAHRLAVPTLWLVAGDDPIADPAVTRAVHGKVRAPSIYEELAGMYHEVFNESDRGRVFELTREFISQHFSL